MASSSKFLGQIAFNLLLVSILLVFLVTNLVNASGSLGENLFLLAVIIAGLNWHWVSGSTVLS